GKVIELTKVYYPESDGKPMGETDWHRKAIIRLIELLEYFYSGQMVYVTGDMLLYYEQGNPKKFVVPDVFVIKGLVQKKRRIIRTWIERKVPDCVIEVTSRKTRKKDAVTKPELYARLGIPEYFLFDPDLDYLDPPLQGYRLAGEAYQSIPRESDGSLVSEQLGLRLFHDNDDLQLFRLDTGERLLTGREQADRARQEQTETLAEVARLRAELARLSTDK
ncbi:MAG TPA: Uma2 family endonuclease, partial [Planctomycetaceae bacterium]|nr:Uma2 family endonuclease [Planctomycetaceae bacterium]